MVSFQIIFINQAVFLRRPFLFRFVFGNFIFKIIISSNRFMRILHRLLILSVLFTLLSYSSFAQLYKIELPEKVKASSVIVEGKVINKKSFWNDAHAMIYTANTIEVYKSFKGNVTEKTMEIMTQGGSVGPDAITVSELLQLDLGKIGIFFCEQNSINLKSPFSKKIFYDVYSSDQGFLRYDIENDEAYAPFASYKKIEENLYKLIQQQTGQSFRVINSAFNISSITEQKALQSGATTLATISSFSPTTVHGGALNDPTNNVLTINGSGFGAKPSGSCAVRFKDGNNDHVIPDYEVPYNSSYITSWSDTKIIVKVPDRAATGNIAVVLKDSTTVQSSSPLTVFFSVLNSEFDFKPGIDTVINLEQRLMNTNGSGGYTIQYSTSTAGGGKDFAASPAKGSFLRALATWKDAVGVNFIEGSGTSVQKVTDDKINLIVFDNRNTGVPVMAAGVLESTYSYATVCYNGSDASSLKVFTAQKTGFDILLRNNGVSVGNIPFEDGPCFPGSGSYDREMIILHELGHGLNLAHINDGEEGNMMPNVNPSKLMHYAIIDYVDRRSLDVSAYQGGLYTTTPQNDNYSSCSSFTKEMTQLSRTVISTDNCPASFPTTATPDGTVVNFDLFHTTSNKFVDPQFTAINCSNSGTQVTNNAYYAFRTGSSSNGGLNLSISDYTTEPLTLSSCTGQGIRISMYDVSTCPEGQNYPQPLACTTFIGDDSISFTGVAADHTYLLYFDGVRNTKASFNVTFSGTGGPAPSSGISLTPNPVTDLLSVSITGANAGKYRFLVYDMLGRLVISQTENISLSAQTVKFNFSNLASAVYIVKVIDPNGNILIKKKVFKHQ